MVDLIQKSVLKSTFRIIKRSPVPLRAPGSFRDFQILYFDSDSESECEDGRGPKRKLARVDNSNGSMANPNGADQNSQEESDLEVNPFFIRPKIINQDAAIIIWLKFSPKFLYFVKTLLYAYFNRSNPN